MCRVLLLWPGTDGAAAGNFGVPQLVTMATYLRAKTGAAITIVDLVAERVLGPVSLSSLATAPDGEPYDVVAFSIYASFDYLKCHAIAELLRPLLPDATFVAGGYHASARPTDVVYDGSPFDVCVVGEGERPMVTLIESVKGGAPLRQVVLGPDAIASLDDELPPTDWSYLDRYRPIARKVAGQLQLYFSRGCPFDCVFCMERAKREVSWRSYSVERAIDELERLHAFVGLEGFTVYIADALFGMRAKWRREMLEAMARRGLPAEKFWLLIRVDMLDRDDLRLFGEANCGLGFGLESGDPAQLAVIRKAGRLDTYLDKMREVARHALELDVPWGANVIVGHPGETEESLRTSAAYLRELFLGDPRGTTGFLSVDPFRLYPGSPIDDERAAFEQRFGCTFHRPEWWRDGDQELLSEWVDPSARLSYVERSALTHELLGPVLRELPRHFSYRGKARRYFLRAAEEQVENRSASYRAHFRDRYYAWNGYLGRRRAARAERRTDRELAAMMLELRAPAVARAGQVAGLDPSLAYHARILAALVRVPRERMVPLDQVLASARDQVIALDESGEATVSALHAYALVARHAEVHEGARVLDLGAGTGYGCAFFAELAGPTGRVLGLELDPALVALADEALGERPSARVAQGDALSPERLAAPDVLALAPTHAVAGFALPTEAALEALAAALPPDTVIVVPVARPTPDAETGRPSQRLVRAVRTADGLAVTELEPVLYVRARSLADLPSREPREPHEPHEPPSEHERDAAPRPRRSLPVVSASEVGE